MQWNALAAIAAANTRPHVADDLHCGIQVKPWCPSGWSAMSGWQYKRENGEIVGILSDDEIKHCAERGGLNLDSQVMHEEKTRGMWVAASRIEPLRNRIEAIQQQCSESAATPPAVMAVYVPPAPPSASAVKLKTLGHGVQQAAASIVLSVTTALERLTAKPPLHVCEKCAGEFARYEVLGKCPLCGEWSIVACRSCGLQAGAKRFVENDCKCPRCGAKVSV